MRRTDEAKGGRQGNVAVLCCFSSTQPPLAFFAKIKVQVTALISILPTLPSG